MWGGWGWGVGVFRASWNDKKKYSHQKKPPNYTLPQPPPPQPGVGINAFLFLARPCFQGKPNDAMTSMQVTSKKEQTGGIEWLPLEVFAVFSGEEGGGRGWTDEGRENAQKSKLKTRSGVNGSHRD